LLIARFVYEYVVIFPQLKKQMMAATAHGATATLPAQPVLHGMLFLVIGYYVLYYLGLLVRARREGHLDPVSQDSGGTGQ